MNLQEVEDLVWLQVPVKWWQAQVSFEVVKIRVMPEPTEDTPEPEPTHAEIDVRMADQAPVTVRFEFGALRRPDIRSRLVAALIGEE